MPENKFQKMIFALITVVITVHAYVFYSLYVVNADALLQATGQSSVTQAIRVQGGVYMFGNMLPVWAVILIEFICAYALECTLGSPLSARLALKQFNPENTNPCQLETAIICATVGIMCPAMSFLAAVFYYPYYAGFSILTLLASWIKLVCYNLPFAYFSQLFFIQPFVRTVFRFIFGRSKSKAGKRAKADASKTSQ